MNNKKKILLTFLPFWTPYIPPQGIAILKAFLIANGYDVKTVDLNINQDLRIYYEEYFEILKNLIPYRKRGNFVNVGHDVMLNHMLSHVNKTDPKLYNDLVQDIIYKTYYHLVQENDIKRLNQVVEELYLKLEKYLIELIQKEKPDVFGSTAYSGTLASCLFAFKLIKKRWPNIKTVIGGGVFSDQIVIGSSNFDFFVENTDYIDKIIVGAGQLLYLKWLEGELPDHQKVYTSVDINGESLPISTNWDLPDLSDLNPSDYLFTAFTGSRSCPFECSFCNVKNFWGGHKVKTAKQIVSEVKELYNSYKNQLFFAYDALLNSHITEFSHEMIASDIAIYYVGYLRVCEEACDINNTLLWRRGGFYRARLGVESGSQHVLDLMDKKITVKQIKGTIRTLAEAGIKTTVYIVIGHPNETEEDFQASLDLIEELKNDIWEAECNPFNYYFSNQNAQDEWSSKRKLVYPEYAKDMLLVQTWTLDIEPLREEVYSRMSRFVQHCDKLGIPNPYTIKEIYQADLRWKKLHKNAVPIVAELKDPFSYVDECKYVKEIKLASTSMQLDEGFNI